MAWIRRCNTAECDENASLTVQTGVDVIGACRKVKARTPNRLCVSAFFVLMEMGKARTGSLERGEDGFEREEEEGEEVESDMKRAAMAKRPTLPLDFCQRFRLGQRPRGESQLERRTRDHSRPGLA